MTDSGGQIIGVTSAFILIFSFSVDSKNETISYVFLVLVCFRAVGAWSCFFRFSVEKSLFLLSIC